jgi:2-polyprenyl-3-methyl-5-hydroxy-6-metoxy-1,4-benzoquinol methylase
VEENASRFDAEAATWDENPRRRLLTEAIARDVFEELPPLPSWRVLEYGCGTASLGLLLAPRVAQVVAADASTGMIEQVRRKLTSRPDIRMTPLLLDLSRQSPPPERFDLIVTAMTMHHVEDLEQVWSRLGAMLAPTGSVAVADLCAEDGSFHAPEHVPHNGFVPEALAKIVQKYVGAARCQWRVIHSFEKNSRSYEVFLLTATRTANGVGP